MNRSVIPSAAYFTVSEANGYPNGHIILAFGRQQRAVLCRLHAYAQLTELERIGQIDAAEAEFLRFQIGESPLPANCPDPVEADIRDLIEDGDKLALFARDYFHPDAEKAMQEAAAELLAMPAIRPGEKRIVQ